MSSGQNLIPKDYNILNYTLKNDLKRKFKNKMCVNKNRVYCNFFVSSGYCLKCGLKMHFNVFKTF